jgi:hypothetical protein
MSAFAVITAALVALAICNAIFKATRRPVGSLPLTLQRVWAAAAHHSGLLRFFVKEENMMLKLRLILSSSLAFASTECCR